MVTGDAEGLRAGTAAGPLRRSPQAWHNSPSRAAAEPRQSPGGEGRETLGPLRVAEPRQDTGDIPAQPHLLRTELWRLLGMPHPPPCHASLPVSPTQSTRTLLGLSGGHWGLAGFAKL